MSRKLLTLFYDFILIFHPIYARAIPLYPKDQDNPLAEALRRPQLPLRCLN